MSWFRRWRSARRFRKQYPWLYTDYPTGKETDHA